MLYRYKLVLCFKISSNKICIYNSISMQFCLPTPLTFFLFLLFFTVKSFHKMVKKLVKDYIITYIKLVRVLMRLCLSQVILLQIQL